MPQSWINAPIGEFCEVVQGQSPPGSTYNTNGEGLPFFQGKAEFGDLYPTPAKWCSAPRKVAQPQDVLISIRAPVGPTNLCPTEACIGRGLAAIRPLSGIPSKYLLYALRTLEATLASKGTGTTFQSVGGATLRSQSIPLAPLAEQSHIVAEIEKQFSRLDAAVAALKRAQAGLKRYRAAVLKAACEGPWPRTTVGEVAEEVRYGTSAKTSEHTDGVPVLRMGNIVDGSLDLSSLKFLPRSHSEFPELLLRAGDVLFNRTNSAELVGKTAVYRGIPSPCSFASYLIRVRLKDRYEPDFLSFYLNSVYGRRWIASVLSQQVGQANVNGTKLKALKIPSPPHVEQSRIVAEVERRLSVVESTETLVEVNLRRADRLRQAILKRAFEGRLVPQDPYDEPASTLLDRVRSERSEEPASGSGGKQGARDKPDRGRCRRKKRTTRTPR